MKKDETVNALLPELILRFIAASLTTFVGSEVEGREMSVGFVITRNSQSQDWFFRAKTGPGQAGGPFLPAPTQMAEPEGADEALGFTAFLRQGNLVYVPNSPFFTWLRSKIIGRADGGCYQPIVVLQPSFSETTAGLQATGLAVVNEAVFTSVANRRETIDDGPLPSAHGLYRALTGSHLSSIAAALWFKPAASLRIYASGDFVGQIMRGRDGLGWIWRDVRQLRSGVVADCREMADSVLDDDNAGGWEGMVERLCDIVVQMSETRTGGAVYFMTSEVFSAITEQQANLMDKPPAHGVQLFRKTLLRGTLNDVSRPCLQSLLREDGSLLCTPRGGLLASGAYFVGDGGRRRIAQNVVRKNPLIRALVLSQDGDLLWYSRQYQGGRSLGTRFLRLDRNDAGGDAANSRGHTFATDGTTQAG